MNEIEKRDAEITEEQQELLQLIEAIRERVNRLEAEKSPAARSLKFRLMEAGL